ncbi:MAG: amino acid adenylation domain-containing protein [Pseudomonadota bacterium]
MAFPLGVTDILPLTPAQRGMLFHTLEATAPQGTYVAVVTCQLEGQLDSDRLRTAFTEAVLARDAYRACFVWEGVKQPVQVLREEIKLPWSLCDWRDTKDIDDRLATLVKIEQARKFTLTEAPLMAVKLLQIEDNRWCLVWTVHHLISDGWSTGIVLRDVLRRYAGLPSEAAKAATLKSYLSWLRKNKSHFDATFWHQQFDQLAAPSLLPERLDIPAAPEQKRIEGALGAPLLREIKVLAQHLEVTTHVVLSAAWALVLRSVLQQDDVVFGHTNGGRPHSLPGVDLAAGAFVNTLPFRVKIDPGQSVADFIREHGQAHQQHADHAFDALVDVQKCTPLAKGTPLFDTLFVNEGISVESLEEGHLRLTDMRVSQSSNYALAMLVTPQGEGKLELYFDTAKYAEHAARLCVLRYIQTLKALSATESISLRDLVWHDAAPPALPPQPRAFDHVIDRFLACVKNTPEAPAVSDRAVTLNYAALCHRARQYAQLLDGMGIGVGDHVPIALPRGAEAIAAFLGVMMTGAAYVPLDLSYPSGRLAQILHEIRPHVMIGALGDDVILQDHRPEEVHPDALGAAMPMSKVRQGPETYVIFTSGSQGRPKGVVISQAALAASTGVRDLVYGSTPDAFLLLSSLAFDSSVAGIYWTLTTGGHLVIAPHRAEQSPMELGNMIRVHQISHCLALPSLAEALLSIVPQADLASLRVLISAGEALSGALAQLRRKVLPRCRLVNEYGPTEATVWCTSFDATTHQGGEAAPIGKALPNVWVGVVDHDLRPVAEGETGEIAIAGPILAEGYLNDPEETAARFKTLGPKGPRAYLTGDLGRRDAAGDIVFLGRKDTQIKIRGHRVELSEVEAAARSFEANIKVLAFISPQRPGHQIMLAVETKDPNWVSNPLREYLQKALPSAFQPQDIIVIDQFPHLPNGKIDGSALRQKAMSAALTTAQVNASDTGGLEQKLVRIFAEVLRTSVCDAQTNFFEAGGDSLSTLSVYAQARQKGITISPSDLFSYPTAAALAAHVRSEAGKTYQHDDRGILQIAHAGSTGTAAFIVHGSIKLFFQVARGLGPDHPTGLLFGHHFADQQPPFYQTIEAMTEEALGQAERLKAQEALVLVGFSTGCGVVLEMAHLLGSDRVKALVLIDPPYNLLGREPSLQPSRFRLGTLPYQRAKLALRRLRYLVRVPQARRRYLANLEDDALRIAGIRIAYTEALARYRVPKLTIPAHILLTPGNPAMRRGDTLDTHLPNKSLHHTAMSHEDLLHSQDSLLQIAELIISACTTDDFKQAAKNT